MSPGARVAQAYANVYGIDDDDDGVTIEDWALVGSDDEMEDSETDDKDSSKTDKKDETIKDYDDVPKYFVYQSYDNYERPEELLAPEYFAPDNTQFYSRVDGALKDKPSTGATTIAKIHKGQAVIRIGIGIIFPTVNI